ncbi:unnamed protein product [Blepharisma stoltei]|uniref:TNFR-Cys domain-containing protein n=1 Tax=Blepharisma stoltei TaxID=1481888 RepID=A0AAU9K863_9CILI|nr:unnamed protein product [Blepharisma stoltei]
MMIFALVSFTKILLTYCCCPSNSSDLYFTCKCSNSYYLADSKVCVNSCPSLFGSNANYGFGYSCSMPNSNNAILFTLEFLNIQDLTATYIASSTSASEHFENPGSISYNSATQNSPLPTVDRGFYFATTSSITSNQSHVPALYFTLNLWIKPLDSGEILNVLLSSSSYIRIWTDSSGVYMFSAIVYNTSSGSISISGASTSSYISSWHQASIILNQSSCSEATINFYINGSNVGTTTSSSTEAKFSGTATYTWTFGNLSGGNSFRGFIYWLQARSDTNRNYGTMSSTIDCVDNQYWDGSACQNCGSGCPTWPWCVRGSSCDICYSPDCSSCYGYSLSMCTACTTGIVPGCCDYFGATCTQTWTNTACISGKVLIGGICLYACPYGFGSCTAVSTAVLTADFTGSFAGSYGTALTTATGSSSYNYWNSPESSDPFPAKCRGFYFNSNQYLSGSINLSNTWSMSLWVLVNSGTIIGHSSNKLNIGSTGINFYLEKWDGTSTSYSASQSITSNVWSYISYSIGFSNKVTTVIPYLNNIAGTAVTVTDYVFRLPSGGVLYIGKGSTNFSGFIAYFILWQVEISDFSSSYSINTLTGGSLSTLWPCDYSHYYDGSVCQPCLGSCTIGCTRGTSCYICDDFLCAQCSSFWSGACTSCISNASGSPCSCNSGFYQPDANQALCSACYAGCAHCTGSSYYLCTSCTSSSYFYNSNFCLSSCPTGYTENSYTKTCVFSSNIGLSIIFYDKIVLDSISGISVGSSNTNTYPNYDTNDPYPAYLRGYYFTGTTYLTTNTVIGPYFSISVWIYPTSAGTIVSKTVSGGEIFCFEILSSEYPQLSITLSDSSALSVALSSSVLNGWNFIAFTGIIDTGYVTTISSYFNSIPIDTGSSVSQVYFQDLSLGTLYIGTKSSLNSGFTGFLYDINIYNSETLKLSDYSTSSCTSPCLSCPSDYNCPDTCPLSQYYDGSACVDCMGTCTKGCRHSNTCRLCKTEQCYECTSFSGSCSSCITNAEADGTGGCQCMTSAIWNSNTANCDLCDALCSVCTQTTYFECSTCISGKQLVGSICLNDCPYGYGASCTLVSTPVIDQSLNTDFQGSYGIFTTGTSSSTYQPFANPESVDPIPAYDRGLYFNGATYLLSSISVYLSHSFSIGLWIYVITDGDILEKEARLILSSTGSITAVMEDPTQALSTQALSAPSTLASGGWSYLSITFEYTSDATTITDFYFSSMDQSLSISNYIYRDVTSTNLMIGKSSSSGFVGFINNFQLWNVPINNFYSYMITFCDTCLWNCDLSNYYDGSSYLSCNSCSKGCVRSGTCNLCDDVLCSICTGFGSGKCTQCVTNASGAPNACVCNSGYIVSSDGFSCLACSSGCSDCTDITYQKCTSCFSGFYFFSLTGQCLSECPTGYTANSGTNACDFSTNLAISLDLTDQVHLDTVSSFSIGSVSANVYPNWSDTNDPIPSYKRGYYFHLNDYIHSTVMISPSFSISIWAKPLGAGILMTKYTSSEILKVIIDSSGYPQLSIYFSDSSLTTLSASSSIINNWNFLSFTGQVQTDGKTTLNLYINATLINYITTSALIYFKDTISGTLYIGNDENHVASGHYGFIARVMIYNSYTYQTDDYATSSCNTGCASCPSSLQCLSNCALNEYPDSCKQCLTSCVHGCVSDLACVLCRDKECYSCTTFDGECTSCITNAYKVNGHCQCSTNAVWVSSPQSCELCDSICSTCSSPEFDSCLICASGYYLIQSLCMPFCPIGYTENGDICDSDSAYTNYFVFNLMPHQIKDIVNDLESNIPVLTGKDNTFYPTYDSTDPIAAIHRGYYFTGSSYMQLPPYSSTPPPLLTFSPKFVISAWIMPISDTGVIFSKQDNGSFGAYITFELKNKFPSLTLTLRDTTIITFTSSNLSLRASLSQWNFISAVSDVSTTPKQSISLTTNTNIDSSGDLHPSWFVDLENSFLITIGASYLDSSNLQSFFNGFLWDLKVYNTLSVTSLTLTTCIGCSLCPIDNSNACLYSCNIDKYWSGSSCASCLSECSSKGCVRADKNCNLCQDVICEICDDYTSTCITCKTNASLLGTSCQCNSGYYWNTNNESCEVCESTCKTCKGSTYLDCLTCADGRYIVSGICTLSCPLGYSKSATACTLVEEMIFDLDLNTLSVLNGVIYDKASSIPVVTGSTKQFYPDYEADDPIPAYLRGFYFNGKSSVLRLPEYSNYTSPQLVIASNFTISIWLNAETTYSAILSKHNISDNYSTFYAIYIISSKPAILITIDSSPIVFMCQGLLNNYEWSHLVFTLENIQSSSNMLSCYINGIFDSSEAAGSKALQDQGLYTTMTIGAQLSSSAVYNFYQGFIYKIQIFNVIKAISSLSTTSCTESCSVCPTDQKCIPNCKIKEYWAGPAYNKCYQCNAKCKNSCRDWRSACSLCDNLLCEDCTDYSAAGCVACKENATNTDSCICDVNYVLDTSNNSTCITVEAGGFRGSDGILYSCPNYCTNCESLTKCNACVENASLKNDLCYCNLGYNGTKNCTLVPFSVKITVLSDNSLYLIFSESLASSLTIDEFTITVENKEVSFKLEQINNTYYYISLTISEAISGGTLATLEFLNLTEVRSASNGVLNSSEISASLNSYDPAPYSPAIAAVTSQAAAGVQGAVSGAVALSVINPSPSSLWSMMNSLQILSYLTLSGIPFSSKMSTFLINLNSFNLFPNAFSYIIDKNEGNTPYSQAKEFGYDSDLILITTGNDFTLIMASLLVLPIIWFFSQCSYRWLAKKFMKTIKAYQFAFYLRFWIQCYLELGAAASIGLATLGLNNITQITNFIICISICVLLIATPPLHFWFSYKNKNRIQSREKTFNALFSPLFYEFRVDRGLLATQYYFVFFIRRFIYIVNLVFLRDYPQTEVTINIVLSLMTIMHLIFFWPFEDPVLQINNLLTEIMIGLVMISSSAYLFNLDQETISTIENAIVAIVIGVMIIQTFSSIAIFARTLYQIIHHKLTKAGIMRNHIQPFNDHPKKVER